MGPSHSPLLVAPRASRGPSITGAPRLPVALVARALLPPAAAIARASAAGGRKPRSRRPARPRARRRVRPGRLRAQAVGDEIRASSRSRASPRPARRRERGRSGRPPTCASKPVRQAGDARAARLDEIGLQRSPLESDVARRRSIHGAAGPRSWRNAVRNDPATTPGRERRDLGRSAGGVGTAMTPPSAAEHEVGSSRLGRAPARARTVSPASRPRAASETRSLPVRAVSNAVRRRTIFSMRRAAEPTPSCRRARWVDDRTAAGVHASSPSRERAIDRRASAGT